MASTDESVVEEEPVDRARAGTSDTTTNSDGTATFTAYACERCESVGFGAEPMQCCGSSMVPVERQRPTESPDLPTLLAHVFGISDTEIAICIALMEEGEMTVTEIASVFDYSEGYVRQLLHHMDDAGLVETRSKLVRGGGRVNVYAHSSLPDVKRAFEEALFDWFEDARALLDDEIIVEKEAALESADVIRQELSTAEDESIYYGRE
ncbi:helix-turn-helix domain-containing protein [Halosolutus amylolyticus]|uniref:Helix-turn-helix domain-containing protein n=1 Tax=Halosolutus amylolyticus TaxID=2932267 RepID=A0ABD5PM42_9EURY|nr:helix-turn-helix domain-containing protein [Halosolutus amylolyticus]